jgi:hypothetical protein
MKGLDLSGFKKVQEDKNRAVLQHPSGHVIQIAKAAIGKPLQAQLAKLPLHQAEPMQPVQNPSTDVGGEDQSLEANQGVPPMTNPGPGGVLSAYHSTDISDQAGAPAKTPAPDSTIAQPQEEPATLEQKVAQLEGGPEELASLRAKATGDVTKAQGEEAAADLLQRHTEEASKYAVDSFKNLDAQTNLLTKDLLSQRINPKAYQENMSTGSKIATAIGLIAGGMASARTGSNPAMTFLQNQIDRNIEAQKANIGIKQNVLSALQHQYGNVEIASKVAAAGEATAYAARMAKAAGAAGQPYAQSALYAGASQLLDKRGQLLRDASLLQLRDAAEGKTPGPEQDIWANTYLRYARQRDPKNAEEFEKRFVPGVGIAQVPLTPEDRQFLDRSNELNRLYDRAESNLKAGGWTGPLLPGSHAESKNLSGQIQLRLGDLADLKRYTPEENKIYQKLVPDLSGTHITDKDAQNLGQLRQSLRDKLNTFYEEKGINRRLQPSPKVVKDARGKPYLKVTR